MHLFHDVRFPLDVAQGARGGPRRKTDIVRLASGGEYRNSPHRHSRREYDAGVGLKSLKDVRALIAFFEARGGELHSFRFRDPVDHEADNALIGVGDGIRTEFALSKRYGDGAASYDRPLRFCEEVGVTPPFPHMVADGVVVFDTPVPDGVDVRASFIFDTVVRFATDRIEVALDDFGAGEVVSVPLIEVLSHEIEP